MQVRREFGNSTSLVPSSRSMVWSHRRGMVRRRKLSRRQRREVIRIIRSNQEYKWFDTVVSPGGVTTAGSFVLLSNVTQGTLDNNRIGDKLKFVSMKGKFTWTVGDNNNLCRVIVFQWHPDNSVTVPVTSGAGGILQSGGANAPYSNYEHDTGSLFTVLYDSTVNLWEQIAATPGSMTAFKQFRIKQTRRNRRFFKTTLKFDAATTTGPDQIYLLAVSDSSVAPNPVLYGYIRMAFQDG